MSKDFVTRVIGKYSSANIYAKVIETEATVWGESHWFKEEAVNED